MILYVFRRHLVNLYVFRWDFVNYWEHLQIIPLGNVRLFRRNHKNDVSFLKTCVFFAEINRIRRNWTISVKGSFFLRGIGRQFFLRQCQFKTALGPRPVWWRPNFGFPSSVIFMKFYVLGVQNDEFGVRRCVSAWKCGTNASRHLPGPKTTVKT